MTTIKTNRKLKAEEIIALARKFNLKVAQTVDYIDVYKYNQNIGLRVADISEPSSFNKWIYQNYGSSVGFERCKEQDVLNFIAELNNF